MYFELEKILSNPDCKRINIFNSDLIVYKCGYVFRYIEKVKKWKLMNFNKTTLGYKYLSFKTGRMMFHRLIYYAFKNIDLIERGDMVIDHINRNKKDNRLSNLRYVLHSINLKNQTAKGYTKHRNKYQVCFMLNYKQYYGGLFKYRLGASIRYKQMKKDITAKLIDKFHKDNERRRIDNDIIKKNKPKKKKIGRPLLVDPNRDYSQVISDDDFWDSDDDPFADTDDEK